MQQAVLARSIAEVPRHGFDGNPPELAAPRDLEGMDKRDLPERENYNTDRIRSLYRRDKIERAQYYAAERLQKDRQMSQVGGFVSPSAGSVRVTVVSSDMPSAKLDAMRRVNAARESMHPTAWRLVELVVLENIGLEVAGKRLWGRNERGVALGALRFALDALAIHYGLLTSSAR